MVVTGFDERSGCGYVLRTGPDMAADPGASTVEHRGLRVAATAELAAMLRDALQRHPVVQVRWGGPEIPLTLDDPTMLTWLQQSVGGVLSVSGGPQPTFG
ncbi:MAG: hypothetical protein AB7J32_17485 [Pseudonocardia sp.]